VVHHGLHMIMAHFESHQYMKNPQNKIFTK